MTFYGRIRTINRFQPDPDPQHRFLPRCSNNNGGVLPLKKDSTGTSFELWSFVGAASILNIIGLAGTLEIDNSHPLVCRILPRVIDFLNSQPADTPAFPKRTPSSEPLGRTQHRLQHSSGNGLYTARSTGCACFCRIQKIYVFNPHPTYAYLTNLTWTENNDPAIT